MSKPSILFIPGSFVLPELYDPVVEAVRAKGCDIKVLHLPSVGPSARTGREGPAPSMHDDAAFVAREVEKLADEGKEVVLMGHSYGGVPITQAVEGLSLQDRRQRGKTGGIVRLAYMTALVPALGSSAAEVLAGVPEEHRAPMEVDVSGPHFHLCLWQANYFSWLSTIVSKTPINGPRKLAGCYSPSRRRPRLSS